jgi:hypothetical protein
LRLPFDGWHRGQPYWLLVTRFWPEARSQEPAAKTLKTLKPEIVDIATFVTFLWEKILVIKKHRR